MINAIAAIPNQSEERNSILPLTFFFPEEGIASYLFMHILYFIKINPNHYVPVLTETSSFISVLVALILYLSFVWPSSEHKVMDEVEDQLRKPPEHTSTGMLKGSLTAQLKQHKVAQPEQKWVPSWCPRGSQVRLVRPLKAYMCTQGPNTHRILYGFVTSVAMLFPMHPVDFLKLPRA